MLSPLITVGLVFHQAARKWLFYLGLYPAGPSPEIEQCGVGVADSGYLHPFFLQSN